MKIKLIDYLTLFCICLVTAVAGPDCIAGINSQVVERGENITFPIHHDSKLGEEYDVTVHFNNTSIAQLICRNVTCELESGSLIVYEHGTLTRMNSSRPDEGNYTIHHKGRFSKNECFNVTVTDDDNLPSNNIRALVTRVVIVVGIGVGIVVGIPAAIFGIYWCWKRRSEIILMLRSVLGILG